MKKLFTSFVVASTVAACGSGAKTDTTDKTTTDKTTTDKTTTDKTTDKTTPVVKGANQKGTFKIGYAGSHFDNTELLKNEVLKYTQDVVHKSQVGDQYLKLPSGLFLQSSQTFNKFIGESKEYVDQTTDEGMANGFKWTLWRRIALLDSDVADNGAENGDFDTAIGANTAGMDKTEAIFGITGDAHATLATEADLKKIFTDEIIGKIYRSLESKIPTPNQLKAAVQKAGINVVDLNFDTAAAAANNTVYFNTNRATQNSPVASDLTSKLFKDVVTEFQSEIQESLSDKSKMADKNLDALFVQVTDEVENSSEIYKTVVEKKAFGNTKLFFIGEESEAQDGSSSKTFAGENVSTASFNKYAAAYIGGFQAAAGAIKYNSTEDMYEETAVSFLIGALEESDDRKKAFAFRRGVEAATKHAEYSKYLKVKFVKKTEDESTSKKLYRGFSDWTNVDDGKTKLYEFAGSDTFRDDVDRSVIYIAGATAKQWSGWHNKAAAKNSKNSFQAGDNTGLVGALYNYNKANFTTDRRYSKGVWVVLDAATSRTADNDTVVNVNTGALSQVREVEKGQVNLERHEVVFYGALGKEASGTKTYAQNAIKGLYMGGPSYMLGKHTIFGAGLDLAHVKVAPWTKQDDSDLHRITPWLFKEKKDGDTASKVEGRFNDSLEFAWEKEVTEAELTKSSPWLK